MTFSLQKLADCIFFELEVSPSYGCKQQPWRFSYIFTDITSFRKGLGRIHCPKSRLHNWTIEKNDRQSRWQFALMRFSSNGKKCQIKCTNDKSTKGGPETETMLWYRICTKTQIGSRPKLSNWDMFYIFELWMWPT